MYYTCIIYVYYKYVYNYRRILRHTLGFHMFGLWECGPGGPQDYTPQLQPSSIAKCILKGATELFVRLQNSSQNAQKMLTSLPPKGIKCYIWTGRLPGSSDDTQNFHHVSTMSGSGGARVAATSGSRGATLWIVALRFAPMISFLNTWVHTLLHVSWSNFFLLFIDLILISNTRR